MAVGHILWRLDISHGGWTCLTTGYIIVVQISRRLETSHCGSSYLTVGYIGSPNLTENVNISLRDTFVDQISRRLGISHCGLHWSIKSEFGLHYNISHFGLHYNISHCGRQIGVHYYGNDKWIYTFVRARMYEESHGRRH